jgi:ribosomal protein S18 acetylase RimI-like enzyme
MKYIILIIICIILLIICYTYKYKYKYNSNEYSKSSEYNDKKYIKITNIIKQRNYNKLLINEKNNIISIYNKCFDVPFDISKDTILFNYYNNGKLVGFVGILSSKNYDKYLSDNNIYNKSHYGLIGANGLFVYNLCVLPKYRKKGIANTLLNHIIKYATQNKIKYINLMVFSNNVNAIKLYKKYNFTEYQRNTAQHNNLEIITMIKYL